MTGIDVAEKAIRDDWDLYIAGRPVAASSNERIEIRNPARGEVLCTVPVASPEDVQRGVEAAHGAFGAWRRETVEARLAVINRCREILKDHVDELAWLDAASCGNPVSACRDDVRSAILTLERMSGAVRGLRGETIDGGRNEDLFYTRWAPFGVVGMIIPFNHPSLFALQSLVPIALGNTVVLKPSEQSPLSALRIAELLGEVLPKGVLNVLTGTGEPTGATLVEHPLVQLVVFTGSSAVGRVVVQQAARLGVKRTVLELGGKNALVVCADAPDLERIAEAAVRGMNVERCQGQSCTSTSRLLVERPVYDLVVAAVGQRMAAIEMGDPLDDATRMGCLVSHSQQKRVLDFIANATAEGATVMTGGGAPTDPALARGAYVEPTLLSGVHPMMTIAREEVFGPVLSAIVWDTDEEAISIANSVSYGLTAAVWTGDLRRAQRFAADLEVSRVFVNGPVRSVHGMVADAWKESGLGLTGDWGSGLANFVQSRAIHMVSP